MGAGRFRLGGSVACRGVAWRGGAGRGVAWRRVAGRSGAEWSWADVGGITRKDRSRFHFHFDFC